MSRFSLTAFLDALTKAGILNLDRRVDLAWDFKIDVRRTEQGWGITVIVPIRLFAQHNEKKRKALVEVAARHGLKPNCHHTDDFWLISEPFGDLIAK